MNPVGCYWGTLPRDVAAGDVIEDEYGVRLTAGVDMKCGQAITVGSDGRAVPLEPMKAARLPQVTETADDQSS